MSTVGGDTMSTPGDFSTLGVIMSTVGDTVSTLRGYPVYTLGVYHDWCGDIMSTLGGGGGGIMSTPEDFGMNGKRPIPNFQDFCSSTFCDYAVVYVGLWNIRQLVKIPLLR